MFWYKVAAVNKKGQHVFAPAGIPIAECVYVGCALTYAPQAFKDAVEHLKEETRRAHIPVLDFVGLTAGTDLDVYETDLSYARGARLFVAICDELSIGLGMEIQARFEVGRPMLLIAQDFLKVTRMVSGGARKHSTTTIMRTYTRLREEGPILVRDAMGYFKLPHPVWS